MESSNRDADEPRDHELDPVDLAWLERRSAAGALTLGIVSILLSPLLLGLLFAPLGVRAAVDGLRRGGRGPMLFVGFGLSVIGLLASVSSALLWGALLSGVLLGRDAIRSAESLRGMSIEPVVIAARFDGVSRGLLLSAPGEPADGSLATHPCVDATGGRAERFALVVLRMGTQPSVDALREIAIASNQHPEIPFVFVDQELDAAAIEQVALRDGGAMRQRDWFVGREGKLPPPLDVIAATPTIVVVDMHGRIEAALVGGYPASDLEKLFRGDARIGNTETEVQVDSGNETRLPRIR